MTNRNFGRLDETNRITYAPVEVTIDGAIHINPSAADYAAAGWLAVVSEPPTLVGVYFTPTEYGDESVLPDGRKVIVRRYEEHPIVAPPVVYVVEEIIYQLIDAGKLQATKAVVGDYWELLTMRDRVDATNEYWAAAYPQVCAGLIAAGVFADQAEIDALLDKCREGYVDEDSWREVR